MHSASSLKAGVIVVLIGVLVVFQFIWLFSGAGINHPFFWEKGKGKGEVEPLAVVVAAPKFADATGSKLHVVVYDRLLRVVGGAEVLVNGKVVGRTDRRGVLVCDLSGEDLLPVEEVVARAVVDGLPARGMVLLSAGQPRKKEEVVEIFAYTDRGVYRPGETVHIRMLGWRVGADVRPLSGARIKVVLKGKDGHELWGRVVWTDDYGVAFCDLPLIKSMPEGYYLLHVEHDGYVSAAPIRVERFNTPVIQIEAEVPEWLTPQDNAFQMKVQAGYYSCMPLEAATCIVEILAQDGVRFRHIGSVGESEPLCLRISGAKLKKLLRGIRADSGHLTVRISVIDRFGRRDTVERVVEYTQSPYIVDVKPPARTLEIGEEFNLRIFVCDRLKRPAAFKMVIVECGGKEHPGVTDENGVALVGLKQTGRTQQMRVFLEGVRHPVATVTTYGTSSKHPIVAETTPALDDKPALVSVTISGRFIPLEKFMHVALVGPEGRIEESFEVRLGLLAQGWCADFEVSPQFWGRGTLIAWCAAKEKETNTPGLLVAGEFLDVDRRGNISVLLSNIQPVVRPGQRLGITVQVQDEEGNPLDAALGACVADAAALSLLDPLNRKPEEAIYAAAQALREGVWPTLVRNWGPWGEGNLAKPPFGWYEASLHRTSWSLKGNGGIERPIIIVGQEKDAIAPQEYDEGNLLEVSRAAFRDFGARALDSTGYIDAYGIGGGTGGRDIPRGTGWDTLSNKNLGTAGHIDRFGLSRVVVAEYQRVRIRIRTNFADTSLWAPDLKAKDGRFDLSFCLPDSITVNRLTLVASDRRGHVKTVMLNIRTSLDFFVRSDMPPVLVLGDEVEFGVVVANRTGRDLCARVEVAGDGLRVLGGSRKSVLVPAGGMAGVRFRVKAVRVGRCTYTVRAVAQNHADGLRRTVEVIPPGQPVIRLIRGTVKNGHCSVRFSLPAGDLKRACLVSVTYPGLQTMLQSVRAMASYPHG